MEIEVQDSLGAASWQHGPPISASLGCDGAWFITYQSGRTKWDIPASMSSLKTIMEDTEGWEDINGEIRYPVQVR
jgi:hypothetical protein